MKKRRPLSKISILHYFKLVFRSGLFIAATVLYIIHRIHHTDSFFGGYEKEPALLGFIWLVFLVEIILRFFPSSIESMGCQKQFKRNFKPTGYTKVPPYFQKRILLVALAWIALNSIIGLLYFFNIIDAGILLLISLAYSVCDMICILFFCPFQTWFMKNKCCGSCRIYNWDYLMMFTPCIFIKNPYTFSLLICSVILFVFWELSAFLHPERFYEPNNEALSCINCPEKLCHHKKQLQGFLKKNRHLLRLTERFRDGEPK